MNSIIDFEWLRTIPVSTISDAIETVTGLRGYMDSAIRPLFPCHIVGRAITVRCQRAQKPAPPTLLMEAIDSATATDVIVISFEGGECNATAWGGLLTMAAKLRGAAGTIVDAGARDVAEIQQQGYPVFSRSVTPSTGAGKFNVVEVGRDIVCGGLRISSGDLVAADLDGVVAFPTTVYNELRQVIDGMEEKEKLVKEYIVKTGSLTEAFKAIQRI